VSWIVLVSVARHVVHGVFVGVMVAMVDVPRGLCFPPPDVLWYQSRHCVGRLGTTEVQEDELQVLCEMVDEWETNVSFACTAADFASGASRLIIQDAQCP
jgi:hypothetical protein